MYDNVDLLSKKERSSSSVVEMTVLIRPYLSPWFSQQLRKEFFEVEICMVREKESRRIYEADDNQYVRLGRPPCGAIITVQYTFS